MLKEFYDFIAKKINNYFQVASNRGLLPRGETLCLKLDEDEMVLEVYVALKMLLYEQEIIGNFRYQSPDGLWFETYTLKCQNDEVVIAAQIDGMSREFLCANIRNVVNKENKSVLLISANPMDSAISGSRDMASNGMPFYIDNLMSDIRNIIEHSTQLTLLEKSILQFELDRKNEDVFSDKYSLFEYRDLLSIVSSGKIDAENFPSFRLFAIDGKADYQNCSKNEIRKILKKNNELFERIDRGIQIGNLESDLAKDFEDKFIKKIEKAKNKDFENWSSNFTFMDCISAMDQKHSKKNKPLQIDKENISSYGTMPMEQILYNEDLFIRDESSMTAKKRTRSVLIFNPKKYKKVTLKVECNVKIPKNGISPDDSQWSRDGINNKDLLFTFEEKELSFHKVEIKDETNLITYILKICIIEIAAHYMIPTLKTNFSVDYRKKITNSRIKLLGVSTDIVFNKDAKNSISEELDDGIQYRCNFDDRLHIYTSEEKLANFDSGIKIGVNFAGLVIPFFLVPDADRSVEIGGKGILKEKFSQRKSFKFVDDKYIFMDSQEYFAKENLLKELRIEKQFIENQMLCATCENYHDTSEPQIKNIELSVSVQLKEAYFAFLECLGAEETIPSLAYLSGNLLYYAKEYVDAVLEVYSTLKDGEILTVEQEETLHLGTILVGDDEEIFLTPFHPLNIVYQMTLLNEKNMKDVTEVILERLNSVSLLPYLKSERKVFKTSEQLNSLEWKHYAPVENKKYLGGRKYVSKLIEEKITEFILHFRYIFEDINNKVIRINLINMGDCEEVFIGIARFYIHAINENADVEKLVKFQLHIYTNYFSENVFLNLKDYSRLKKYLAKLKLTLKSGIAMSNLEGILSKNVDCYFQKDNGNNYEYSHISFYEMESNQTSETATMNKIETGISLGGVLSGVPSSKYGQKYRTGFGTKFAEENELIDMAALYNSLVEVGQTGNPYHSGVSITTQIDSHSEIKMEYIYKSSNWVVFVEPKVDLDFFCEKEANSDLLIIHYSDQYTSSSGYDAITVTYKSEQYAKIIQEYLNGKSVHADMSDIKKIINLFNAVNGDWLLRLVSAKKIVGVNKDSTFSREKISIVAAIKFMLAYLKHPDIIWIPISMEEMLRVSGGAGLSQKEGILSSKNLGFDSGPTCDDLLFLGLSQNADGIEIYFYPVEIKTGKNDSNVITKAFKQVKSTSKGLEQALNPEGALAETIVYKVHRNFMMQLLITSCKKMDVYHVDDSQDWKLVLEKFRQALLNERYVISNKIQKILGIGAVLSFKREQISRKASLVEDMINFIEMPEADEYGLILKSVKEIFEDIYDEKEESSLVNGKEFNFLFGNMSNTSSMLDGNIDDLVSHGMDQEEEMQKDQNTYINYEEAKEESKEPALCDGQKIGIQVLFGNNQQNGEKVIWEPNNTDKLFHTNTGIIGTMGTGKTQFTQSIIAQFYQARENNIFSNDVGILIFDYKGDYNENKVDFVKFTDAKVYKPYHLPFNPFALHWSGTPKPLLPVHTANTFIDTLSKVYPSLGPKQKSVLLDCINAAYMNCGIHKANPATWVNEPPTFLSVYQMYKNDEEIKKGDVLESALNKISMFEIFEPVSSNTVGLFELLKGVVVIDLFGYDSDIQNLVVAMTLDLFYSQMQAAGHSKIQGSMRQISKMILVDEADNFLREGYSSLRKILKEGREFGVGTILSTQFLRHFVTKEEDYSKYILTWVVHNVRDLAPCDVRFVFNTQSGSSNENQLCADIKSLKKHESILKIGNSDTPVYIRDKAFWEYVLEHS